MTHQPPFVIADTLSENPILVGGITTEGFWYALIEKNWTLQAVALRPSYWGKYFFKSNHSVVAALRDLQRAANKKGSNPEAVELFNRLCQQEGIPEMETATLPAAPKLAHGAEREVHSKAAAKEAQKKVSAANKPKVATPTKKSAAPTKTAPAKKAAAPTKTAPAKAAPAKAAPAKKAPAGPVNYKVLIKANPCREGTFCFDQVNALMSSSDTGEAAKKLARKHERALEVNWAVKKGYIALK